MKKNEKIIIFISVICMVGFLLFATTYAFFSYNKKQDEENVYKTGCYNIVYDETRTGVTVENAFPVSDENAKARAKSGKLTPYELKITNNCKANMSYNVILNVLNGSTTSNDYIRVGLRSATNDTAISSIDYEAKGLKAGSSDSLAEATPNITESNKAYILKSETLNSGESITYQFVSWMSSTVVDGQGENTQFLNKISVDVT